MKSYSLIVEVVQTRVYRVEAHDKVEAEVAVRDEFEVMEFDVVEEEINSVEIEEEAD